MMAREKKKEKTPFPILKVKTPLFSGNGLEKEEW